jgi:hypothetical protein
MNQHLQKANDDYTHDGVDLQGLLSWHLVHGAVVCNADTFALGYHTDSGRIGEAVLYEHSDTLFVTYCTGDMLRAVLPFIDRYEFVAWQRSFKGSSRVRIFRMDRIIQKLT